MATSMLARSGDNLMKTAMAIREESRRERFLNAKTRTIGVDKDALDRAVREHEEDKHQKAVEEAAYAEFVSKVVEVQEQNERDDMSRRIDAELEQLAYWQLQSDKTRRKEFDLNDPKALAKERPARVGDDDERCGPSSMQMFAGEDLHKKEHDSQKMQALLDGINAQLADHERAKAAKAAADSEYYRYESALLHDLQVADLEQQRDDLLERIRVQNENKMLARARRIREREEDEAAKRAARDEIDAARRSDLLCESRSLGYNYADPSRVRRDHFKGMSQEQLADIRAEQEEQRRQLAARRAAEEAERRDWGARVRAQVEATAEMEAEAAADKAREQREYYLALKAQQRAAKLRAKSTREEYSNSLDNSYFDKWNATMHN